MAIALMVVGVLSAALTVCYAAGFFSGSSERWRASEEDLVALTTEVAVAARTSGAVQTPGELAPGRSTLAGV